MGKLSPKKPGTSQAVLEAERRAKEAEAKTKAEELQAKMDEEYRTKKQRGKASTILTGDDAGTGRTLLGG